MSGNGTIDGALSVGSFSAAVLSASLFSGGDFLRLRPPTLPAVHVSSDVEVLGTLSGGTANLGPVSCSTLTADTGVINTLTVNSSATVDNNLHVMLGSNLDGDVIAGASFVQNNAASTVSFAANVSMSMALSVTDDVLLTPNISMRTCCEELGTCPGMLSVFCGQQIYPAPFWTPVPPTTQTQVGYQQLIGDLRAIDTLFASIVINGYNPSLAAPPLIPTMSEPLRYNLYVQPGNNQMIGSSNQLNQISSLIVSSDGGGSNNKQFIVDPVQPYLFETIGPGNQLPMGYPVLSTPSCPAGPYVAVTAIRGSVELGTATSACESIGGTGELTHNYGDLTVDGVFTVTSGGMCAVTCPGPSDPRIKTDLQPMNITDAMERVLALTPISYGYTEAWLNITGRQGQLDLRTVGFNANITKDIIPESVSTSARFNKPIPGSPTGASLELMDFRRMEMNLIIPYLVAAFQKQNQIIQAQQLTIDQLSTRVTTLENCVTC